MNTLLKYSINILLICLSANSFCQKSNHFGLDLTKTLSYNILFEDKGFIIEPIYIKLPDSLSIKFKSVVGYGVVQRDNLYGNSNMKTQGYYFKPGIGYSSSNKVIPFINLLLANYSIDNEFIIEGSYFGDYSENYYHSSLFAFGIEPNFDFRFLISTRLSIIISARLTYILYNSEDKDYPTYFIPGAGVVDNGTMSGGLNMYLTF